MFFNGKAALHQTVNLWHMECGCGILLLSHDTITDLMIIVLVTFEVRVIGTFCTLVWPLRNLFLKNLKE